MNAAELMIASVLTVSASLTWWARAHWGHKIVNPALLYLGVFLTIFCAARWVDVFFDIFDDDPEMLVFPTFIQVGLILVLWSGKEFHAAAEERKAAWQNRLNDKE